MLCLDFTSIDSYLAYHATIFLLPSLSVDGPVGVRVVAAAVVGAVARAGGRRRRLRTAGRRRRRAGAPSVRLEAERHAAPRDASWHRHRHRHRRLQE